MAKCIGGGLLRHGSSHAMNTEVGFQGHLVMILYAVSLEETCMPKLPSPLLLRLSNLSVVLVGGAKIAFV